MSENQEFEKQPHAGDVQPSVDRLLEALADILKAEQSPDDPDFQTRKASLLRQLDEYSLDADSRRAKLDKNFDHAAEAYTEALSASRVSPKDFLAKTRLEVAAEALGRASFQKQVDQELLEAQQRFQDSHDAAARPLDEVFLSRLGEQAQILNQTHSENPDEPNQAAREKKYSIAYQLQGKLLSISKGRNDATRAITDLQMRYQERVDAWRAINEKIAERQADITGKISMLNHHLGLGDFLSLTQSGGLAAQIDKKPLPLLRSVLSDADDIILAVDALNAFLQKQAEGEQ